MIGWAAYNELEHEEYEKQKEIYKQGMELYDKALSQHADQNVLNKIKDAYVSLALVILCLITGIITLYLWSMHHLLML